MRIFSVFLIQAIFFCNVGCALTVKQVFNLASKLEEDAQPTGQESWLDPNFSHIYDQMFASCMMRRFLLDLGLDIGPMKQADFLTSLRSYHAISGPLQKQSGEVFLQLTIAEGDRIMVVGDAHGAIHSFARLLVYWFSQGIISEDLQIRDPRLKIVFLGDYVNRSPYGFFLLPLLIEFSNKNDGSVILLRGRQERDGYWEQFLASREFLNRLVGMPFEQKNINFVPLAVDINNFFAQLCDGIVCEHAQRADRMVISHHALPNNFVPSPNSVALVHGELRQLRSVSGRGLVFDQFVKGTATWNVFSAPVPVYSRLGILENDCYAVINIGSSCACSTITGAELSRLPIVSEEFPKTVSIPDTYTFSLAYGQELMTKAEREALTKTKPWFVCSSVALTGGLRSMGVGLKEGVEAGCLRANAVQALPGYKLRPVFLDDQYEPELMERNVAIFRSMFGADSMLVAMGSPTVSRIVPLVEKDGLVLFFPATGSPLFRISSLKNMIHVRHSYAEEVYPLLDRIAKVYGVKRFAFVYQDDSFGAPLTQAAVAYLQKHFSDAAIQTIPILRGHTPSVQDVATLNEFNPEAIGLFISTQLQLSGFADRLGIGFLLGKYLFAIDFSTDIFHEFATRWGVQVMQASSFESPSGRYGKLMNEYRYAMQRYRYPLSITSVEGFVAASLYIAAAAKSYPDLSALAIKKQLEKLDNETLLGYRAPFDQQIRSFVGPVWITDQGRLYRAEKASKGYAFISA